MAYKSSTVGNFQIEQFVENQIAYIQLGKMIIKNRLKTYIFSTVFTGEPQACNTVFSFLESQDYSVIKALWDSNL